MRTKIEKKLKGKKEISLNKLSYAKKITSRLLLLFIQSLRMRKAMLVYLSRIFQESRTEKKMRHLQLKEKSLKFIIMKLYLILFLVQNLLDIIM